MQLSEESSILHLHVWLLDTYGFKLGINIFFRNTLFAHLALPTRLKHPTLTCTSMSHNERKTKKKDSDLRMLSEMFEVSG